MDGRHIPLDFSCCDWTSAGRLMQCFVTRVMLVNLSVCITNSSVNCRLLYSPVFSTVSTVTPFLWRCYCFRVLCLLRNWKTATWHDFGLPPRSSWEMRPSGVLLSLFLDSWTVRMGPIGCPEMAVNNHQLTVRNIRKEQISRMKEFYGTGFRSRSVSEFGVSGVSPSNSDTAYC